MPELKETKKEAKGLKYSLEIEGEEIGRAFIYIMYNDLHEEPFALLEDVYVDENHRGKGIGKQLVKVAIEGAKKRGCYKLIATSRYARDTVHQFYKNLGFKERGFEFRMNF
jgi:GNAT superfamily N-acetyltransferase